MTTFEAVGLPRGVIQVIHADMQVTAKLAADARIGFLSFTGSVAGGRILAKAAAEGEGFKGVGLELGGKDPAYVRSDVDVKWAAAELVDGMQILSEPDERAQLSAFFSTNRIHVQLWTILLCSRANLRSLIRVRPVYRGIC